MRLSLCLFLLVVALPYVHPHAARAQLLTMREYERQLDSERAALGLDLNMFFGRAADAGYTFLQPTILGAARYKEVVIEGALPWAYFHENHESDPDHDQFAIGNPWFALAYLPDCKCGLSRLSLGLAVDATKSDTARQRQAQWLARGAMGDWDGYLWIDRMLPLVAGVSTRLDSGRVQLQWDADLIFGLPASYRDFEFGMQHAGELAIIFNWHLQLAGRITAAWYPTMEGDDFQSSVAFYLRYVVVSDAIGARFVMNIDPPHGFAFTREGMWGLGLFYHTKF